MQSMQEKAQWLTRKLKMQGCLQASCHHRRSRQNHAQSAKEKLSTSEIERFNGSGSDFACGDYAEISEICWLISVKRTGQ